MKLFEVRDIVRENVGRDKISEHLLQYSLSQGLRNIEKTGDYWWMRGTKTWNVIINQQAYNLTTSASGGLNLPNWKKNRVLLTQDGTLTNPDWDEVFGPIDIEEAGLEFADTDNGMPVIYSVDESTITATEEDPSATTPAQLLVWPNNPDKTYNMRLHYYQWTSLPASTSSEAHEVLKRFPEALIFSATEVGIVTMTKDPTLGVYWHQKLDNPGNHHDPGEMTKIRRLNNERSQDSRTEFRPQRGSLMNRRSRWRRNREIWI